MGYPTPSQQICDAIMITYFLSRLQVLTKDSVTVSVDAVVYYRVSNATVSVANVENAHHSTRLLAQTTLRNILGTKNLHEILSDRESISGSMQVSFSTIICLFQWFSTVFLFTAPLLNKMNLAVHLNTLTTSLRHPWILLFTCSSRNCGKC